MKTLRNVSACVTKHMSMLHRCHANKSHFFRFVALGTILRNLKSLKKLTSEQGRAFGDNVTSSVLNMSLSIIVSYKIVIMATLG